MILVKRIVEETRTIFLFENIDTQSQLIVSEEGDVAFNADAAQMRQMLVTAKQMFPDTFEGA